MFVKKACSVVYKRAQARFIRVLWFYWTLWIYVQSYVVNVVRHLSPFQGGNGAVGIKLETTDIQKEEDPLAVMLPVMKTEQEVYS